MQRLRSKFCVIQILNYVSWKCHKFNLVWDILKQEEKNLSHDICLIPQYLMIFLINEQLHRVLTLVNDDLELLRHTSQIETVKSGKPHAKKNKEWRQLKWVLVIEILSWTIVELFIMFGLVMQSLVYFFAFLIFLWRKRRNRIIWKQKQH